jgi:uncharacterized damage-inducible protein DinB
MDSVIQTLEPAEGLSREIGLLVAALEQARSKTYEVLSGLSPTEIARKILPNAHSIGTIAMHLGEVEYWWIQSAAMKREMSEQGKKLSHWQDTFETDVDKGFTSEYCIETLKKISLLTREAMASFTDEGLEVLYTRPEIEGRSVSLRWLLQNLIDHEANHRGQMAMVKRLIRETED